jgi:hypothetical protein
VTATGDDDPPNPAASGDDATAAVADSPRTVAGEQYSEPPTTIVPDVGPSRASELAWSSEADTEELSDHRQGWMGGCCGFPWWRCYVPVFAVVVWFSLTLYRQHERPVRTSPTPPAPVATPRSSAPRPAAPPPIPPTSAPPLPTTTPASATASGPKIGEPCPDWSKIARDNNTGLTIICDGATGAGAGPPHWTTDDLSHVIGVQTIGSSCAGSQPYAMAISPDDYLVACFPADAGSDQLAGHGSTWQIYHP